MEAGSAPDTREAATLADTLLEAIIAGLRLLLLLLLLLLCCCC